MEKKIILLLSVGLANKTYCDHNDKFLPFHSDCVSLYTFFRSVLAPPDTQIWENHSWELSNAASYYSTSCNDPLHYESQIL